MVDIDKLLNADAMSFQIMSRQIMDSDDGTICAVFLQLVNRKEYVRLAELISYATLTLVNNASSYFAFMIQKAESFGLTVIDILPIVIKSAYAPNGSVLKAFEPDAHVYIQKMASSDFETVMKALDEHDAHYRFYIDLLNANRAKTVNHLLNKVLNSKGGNKTDMRRVLRFCPEIVDILYDEYLKGDAKRRSDVTRLLVMFKSDYRVNQFLNEIVKNDKSVSVQMIYHKSEAEPILNKPRSVNLERAMQTGEVFSEQEFKDLIVSNPQSEQLFFIRDVDGVQQISVVTNGVICDTANKPLPPNDLARYTLMHPADLDTKFNPILSLKIEQPFLQIGRPVFTLSNSDKFISNYTALDGVCTDEKTFFANAAKLKFSSYVEGTNVLIYTLGAFTELVKYSPNMDFITLNTLCFFKSADILRLSRKAYVNESLKIPLSVLPERIFSEFIYMANRLMSQ